MWYRPRLLASHVGLIDAKAPGVVGGTLIGRTCIMKASNCKYPLATKARVIWDQVGAGAVASDMPLSFSHTPQHPRLPAFWQTFLERHNKAEDVLPRTDVTEQWECKANLQALGVLWGRACVGVVRGKAVRAW